MQCAKEIVILLVTMILFVSSQSEIDSPLSEIQNFSAPLDVKSYPGELCFRDCNDVTSRVCYFHWHLEHYQAMGAACKACARGNIQDCFEEQCLTADGKERGVMSINRKIPGPAIHVCRNDQIVVDVTNLMGGTASTIHWHGFHQRETPYMDGVPFVTQCPIPFGTTFRYSFKATEAGTQFYHSHSGHHKVNGHYGGIVVRDTEVRDPNRHLYDFDVKEHLIVASDWMEEDGEMFMPGLVSHPIGIQPTNLLINGKGTIRNFTTRRSITRSPLEVFRVNRGLRYRFRFINSASHVCPMLIEIEGHKIEIVASDSYNLQPTIVDTLISTSGERYDFVIHTNQLKDFFWIRLRAIGACENRQVEQFAVLSYAPSNINSMTLAYPNGNFPHYGNTFNRLQLLNHPNTTCGVNNPSEYCVSDLKSYVERPSITEAVPNHRFYLGFNNYNQRLDQVFGKNQYEHFMNLRNDLVLVGAINNITMTFPPFSLLTQPEEIKENMFCDENSIPERCTKNGVQLCPCIHRLKIELNSIVELVIVDETAAANNLNHPFHLHGYPLYVMGMGQLSDKRPMTIALAKRMTRTRSFKMAPTTYYAVKDTVSIPSKGYTIIRFRADNPGFWLMHCHFEWHMAVGMGLVLQVGETSEMVKPPKNFPKCNSYTPDL